MIRTHKLGEADRIITLLSKNHGKIRAVAKGVRRTKSRFGARLEPFSHVDCQLYTGRNLDIITQTESIHPFGLAIAADYDLYSAGSVLLETADRLVFEEGEPDTSQYLVLLGALNALATKAHPPRLIVAAYLLRALAYAGFELAVRTCAVCGKPGPHQAFNVAAGGAVCQACRPPGSAAPGIDVLDLLDSLMSGDWTTDPSLATQKQACALASAFAQWHMERHISSLTLLGRS